jgi:signal-transduction protein with cAMP-binding, CBS, and nucleotidyltransferase domain
MTESTITSIEFLKSVPPFDLMDDSAINRVAALFEPLRYRMGQPILVKESLPTKISILYKGKARLVGYPPGAEAPETLELLEPGAIIGGVLLNCSSFDRINLFDYQNKRFS